VVDERRAQALATAKDELPQALVEVGQAVGGLAVRRLGPQPTIQLRRQVLTEAVERTLKAHQGGGSPTPGSHRDVPRHSR